MHWGLRHPLVLVLGGFVLLVFLLRIGLSIPIERGLAYIFYPVQSRLYRAAIALRELPLFHWNEERSRDRERDALIAERIALAKQITAYRFAADENQTLRKLLRFREEANASLVSARVLARQMDPGTFSVFLDRGTDDGIQVGMPVVSDEGVLVGRIVRTHATLAEAAFLPDPRFRAAVTLVATPGTNGYLKGEGGVSILMDLIPTENIITKGDLVVTSGLETGIPQGLTIGTIELELPSQQSLFRRAALQPLIPLHRVTNVAIIVPPKPQ